MIVLLWISASRCAWAEQSPAVRHSLRELSVVGNSRDLISVPRAGGDSQVSRGGCSVSHSVATEPNGQGAGSADLGRAKFIKLVLSHRLDYVASGKRTKDIAQWMKQNKGDPSSNMYFMHGTTNHQESNGSQESNQANNRSGDAVVVVSTSESKLLKQLRRYPFPLDRMNLDIDSLSQSNGNGNDNSTHVARNAYSDATNPPSILQLGIRLVQLSIHFAPVWSTVGLAVVFKSFREQVWYRWLATSIGSCGPAWIKWGQWSSTRNDMFPEALCDHLATLHAAAPAHSWSYSKSSVEDSLGLRKDTLEHVFDQFDEQPLASGSIAQVHKAVLCGRPVAVKIRHPRVMQLMEIDFRLMMGAAALMDLLPAFSWLHIRETVTQFSYSIAAQAHLQVEAHHLEVLNYNFRRWPRVGFPIPFYASSSVIIETFEPGRIASDIINAYERLATSANNGDGSTDPGVEVIEQHDETDADAYQLDTPEIAIEGHDIMPLDLAKFMVSKGVGLYLKMLLVDNLVSGIRPLLAVLCLPFLPFHFMPSRCRCMLIFILETSWLTPSIARNEDQCRNARKRRYRYKTRRCGAKPVEKPFPQ
jgi:ABC1 atypical kinase-like domain